MTELNRTAPRIPLCVDLDGTLIKSDILMESFFALLKTNLLYIFLVPLWLMKGKAFLKQQIADRVSIDVSLLPYHHDFLSYLKKEAENGRPLILATASNRKFANLIADHLGIFNMVFASDNHTNLSGSTKLGVFTEQFGEGQFDYAANANVDIPVWRHANHAILVNPERGVESKARDIADVARVFDDREGGLWPYLTAVRPHQWLKNLLIFVPLFTAHLMGNPTLAIQSVLAFIAFSLCASSVYLLNDMLDLSADRSHPRKRLRPFAAGTIKPLNGALLIPALLAASYLVSIALPTMFMLVLTVYFSITLAYSFFLKRVVLIDVLVLAGLYTLRVIAGAAAIQVNLSFWLLAFSMFVFLSLALVKRCAELHTQRAQHQEKTKGRGYRVTDLEYLHSMGTASGYLSILVMALYVNSQDVYEYYSRPQALWLICPLLLYWISRIWLKAGRGEMHDDPLVFAIKDRGSQYVGIAVLIVLLLAS